MKKQAVNSPLGVSMPIFSQAIVHNGLVYVSGNVGVVPATMEVVGPGVSERTRQALINIKNVLEEAGSGMDKILKCNIYLTDMTNFAAMNKVYLEMVPDPKPARTCVAVAELPFKTDVEIECVAHLDEPKRKRKSKL